MATEITIEASHGSPGRFQAEGLISRVLLVGLESTTLRGGEVEVSGRISKVSIPAVESRVWKLGRSRRGRADELQRSNLAAGVALKKAFLPDVVTEQLRLVLGQAESNGAILALGLEIDPKWQELPWETMALSPGEPLALHPRVAIYRLAGDLDTAPTIVVPQPLRILVAIGSPEQQNRSGSLLDMEAELARILGAVEEARQTNRGVVVRILENGTLKAIRQALQEMPTTCCTSPAMPLPGC